MTEIVAITTKVEAETVPKWTSRLDPIISPTFKGGEAIGIPCTFIFQAEITDRKVSLELIVVSTGNKREEAALDIKIECLSETGHCFATFHAPKDKYKAGETCPWEDAFTVPLAYSHASDHPRYLFKIVAMVSIVGVPNSTCDPCPTPGRLASAEPIYFTDSPEEADLFLEAQGAIFGVQSSVLTERSPVIQCLLVSMNEVTELCLGTDEDTAFLALTLLHSGSLPSDTTLDEMGRLLNLAETYEIEVLYQACYDRLVDLVVPDDEENMKTIRDLVSRYGSHEVLRELLNVCEPVAPLLESDLDEDENDREDVSEDNDADDDADDQ